MKIFAFDSGETDYIFAPSLNEAKKFYKNFTGEDDLSGIEMKCIPKTDWKNRYILDPTVNEPDGDFHDKKMYRHGKLIMQTFADYANENSQTDIIATTAY